MYDVIEKKRDDRELIRERIELFARGYVSDDVPDYQASAFLMAIYFKGMIEEEIATLTMSMTDPGDMVDLSSTLGTRVNKHSTGGVGDKTMSAVSPIVTSLGAPVAKMNGRDLEYTGGTVGKMESIPGMQIFPDRERFFDIIRKVGVNVIGQSGNLIPADKEPYAPHDVTAAVDSIPLIASSIMGKKIAAGSDCILLDAKESSDAFMKTVDDSILLAETIVSIGERVGHRTAALITDISHPLGNAIGNSLEIREVYDTLKGHNPTDLTAICIELAANILYLAGKGSIEGCKRMAQGQLHNGETYEYLEEVVAAQGDNIAVLDDDSKFQQAKVRREVYAQQNGWFYAMDTEKYGIASVEFGAGRERKDDSTNYSAGIILKKKVSDKAQKGEPLAVFYTSDPSRCAQAKRLLESAVTIRDGAPEEAPPIYMRITCDGVERY